MQPVDDPLAFKFFIRDRGAFVIDAGAVDIQKVCSLRNGDFLSRQKVSD